MGGQGVSTPLDASRLKSGNPFGSSSWGNPQTLAGSLPLRYRPWRLPLGEDRTASPQRWLLYAS
ncbi:hypothetical protein [Nostoc sp.]|uniref:hypothetical protein n=1 Tax=Nostoc sp. TaxID=1180 RepID=UPI002FF94B29